MSDRYFWQQQISESTGFTAGLVILQINEEMSVLDNLTLLYPSISWQTIRTHSSPRGMDKGIARCWMNCLQTVQVEHHITISTNSPPWFPFDNRTRINSLSKSSLSKEAESNMTSLHQKLQHHTFRSWNKDTDFPAQFYTMSSDLQTCTSNYLSKQLNL